jgi:exosortase A-associated hydrolase 2
VEAFFLPAENGARFCVYYPPSGAMGSGVIFAPAFAEEMNKSRHVVAQTSRRLAKMGFGVLLIDLLGCGDSTGAFEDATWDDWRNDMRLAVGFMQKRGHARLTLWGMRLGAALAAQCAAEGAGAVQHCVFWQPVVDGAVHLAQFLRLRVAGAALSGDKGGETGRGLRERWQRGEVLEVAGYRLAPALAAAVDRLRLEPLCPPCPVHWFDVVPEGNGSPLPAAQRVVSAWQRQNAAVTYQPIVGESFWAATNGAELVQCDALVDATARESHAWK